MEVGSTEGGATMPAPLVIPLFVTLFVFLVSWLLSRDRQVNVTKRRDVQLTNESADRGARFENRTNGGLQTIAEEVENNGGLNNGANSEHDKFANCHLRLTLTIKEVDCVLPTQSTFKRQLSRRAIENVARSESDGIRDFAPSRDHSQDQQTTHRGKSDDISVSKDAELVSHPQDFNLESRVTSAAWEELEQRYKDKKDSQEANVALEERNLWISEKKLFCGVKSVKEQVCEKRRCRETTYHSRNPEFRVSHIHNTSTILQQVTVTNSKGFIREKSTVKSCENTNKPNDLLRLHGSFESGKTDDSLSGDDVTTVDVTGGCSNDLKRLASSEVDSTSDASSTAGVTSRGERPHVSVLLRVVPSVTEDLVVHKGNCNDRSEPLISNSPCTSATNLSREDREATRIASKPCLRDLSNARNMALKSILRNSPSKESLNKICDRGQKVTDGTNKDGGRREVDSSQVTAVHTIAGKRKESSVTDSNLPEGRDVQTDHNHGKKQFPQKTATGKTGNSTQVTNTQSRFNSDDNVQSQCSKELRSSSRNLTSPTFLETEIPVGQDFYPVRDDAGSTSLPAEEISRDKITITGNSAHTEHTTGVCGKSDSVRSGTYSDSALSSAMENPPMSFIFVISKRRGSKQIAGGLNESDGIPSGHKNGPEKEDLKLNKAAVLDKERGVKSRKRGGEGHSYQSCHGIKRTTEQKKDLQQGKHVLTRNTGAIIPAFANANMLPSFGNGTEGAINVCETETQKPSLTFDYDLESPTVEVNVVKQGDKLNAEKCGLRNNLSAQEGVQNSAKSVTFKLEREIVATTEGEKQLARLNGGIKNKSKDTIACAPSNGLELSEFESALTTLSENRHSAIPPNVGTVNSGTKARLDGVDSGLLDSDGSNIKGKRRNMDGRKYPLQTTEARKESEDRAKDMSSFWQSYDLLLETDSDTTSTLSSPTFGSSTNASYGGSSSNSSSDFDVWKFDWGLKKKREKREDATTRILRKKDAIAETTDSSEDLEGSLQKSGPDVQHKQTSKEVYLLTNGQTCESGASTHIGNNLAQINPVTQRVGSEGAQVFQGDLTGIDHLDDPMHGGKVPSSGTDATNQYSRGRAFALVAAGRPNGQQRVQNVRGDREPSENVGTNFFDANFPNGRVFVALGTKGEVTRGVNGDTGSINDDLISREISVTQATSGGTTGRGHRGHGSPGRVVRYGSGERASDCGESANRAEETVNIPAVTSPLPVITVTSDDEDRPQTNVIFSKDNNKSSDDLNRCNNTPSAHKGLDITLTRSFWTQSCDPLPENRKVVEQVNGWEEKAGSLPDVRFADVFSENFGPGRHSEIANSVNDLSQGSLNEFGLASDLHPEKVGCEEGDTLSGRFPSSKGTDSADICQNSRSDIENTRGTVTGDRQQFSRTQLEMVVLEAPVKRHELNGEEGSVNSVRTENQGMIREKRSEENGDVNHFGVKPMDKVSPRRSVSAMEPRETGPFFRSETHIDIPAAKPLRRQDSLTKSSGIFFSSSDFVNKPTVRSELKITTGRATDLDTAMRVRNREYEKFNLISTYPGDRVVARSRVKGQANSEVLRHEQRKARMLRSRSKSPNEIRVQEALRKLDLPGWYVNSDVAKVGSESPVLKRSRSADTTLSDSGVGTLPRQNQGDKMSSPSGEDPHPIPRKISPPSGQEPGHHRGRRQSREERLSEFYSQRKLHPYPNSRNSQDNRETQSPPVCNGAAAMVAEDSSPEQNRRSTRAAEPDSRESTPEHSPKAAGDHEHERFNTTWSSSEMSIDLPSSDGRPESTQPTLSPPLHRKTPPVITLSASPTRYAALTRSNPNLHELGKTDDQNVTITITETPRLDAPFTGMKDLENQNEDVSLEDMLDSLLALGSRRSSKSGSQSPNETRRLSEDRLENLVAETLPFERRASDPGTTNNQLESTLLSTHTTYDFAEALDALNTTSSSVDTSYMNTTSSSLDTAVEANTSSPKSLTSPLQTSSFFETASSAAPDTTSGSFSASELRDMVTDEIVTVRCSYAKCKRAAELKEARQSYKSCHNCYTYYCSRDCRKNHWERHKKKCVFSQINSACKHILQYSRTNEEAQKCFSRVARTGYLSRGRGCVLLSFASLQDAQDFLNSGLPALPTLPGYKTYRELESVQTEPKDPHTETLITMVTTCDPDVKMVLDVSIAVDTTNVKANLVPRREGPNIRQCAKIRLSERHIVKKTREEQSDEPEAATMILTSPPGSPEKMQHISDRRSREICFINIQRNLRARGVILRHQYPDVYRKLCVYVEKNESFPPVTIYPRDTNTGKTFMCLIMPDSDPEILEWVQNPDLLEDIIA